MKIILFGGSGMLGRALLKLNPEIIAPTHQQVDISIAGRVIDYIAAMNPDIVINAAAVTDNRLVEVSPDSAIETNIIGSANIARACINSHIRLVYISTDYIYKGDRGNYKETDEILPFNLYSWTKLGGESSVKCIKNHLIIRTSFGADFSYPQAFSDKYASKDYVDVIAPMIYEAALSPVTGVLNIGTSRKTLYDHARERNLEVLPIKIDDSPFNTPKDTSLNLQKWIDYKSDKSIATPHTKCRCCGAGDMTKYLDLGIMPLANNLEFTSQRAKEKERFPLQVLFCNDCGLSQLSVVIDPGKMFSYYTYRSSVNGGYVRHCREMARSLKEKFNLTPESFCIDVAGNDGALLKEFRDEIGCKVLNVDPATNLTAIAESMGIECVTDFWCERVASRISRKADVITATNVFAHVDNINDFVKSAHDRLNDNGVLVIEVPYLVDFIEKCEFDTVYFEHLSYMSVLPVMRLCKNNNLKIISVEKQNIHGGTIRITIAKEASSHQIDKSVSDFVNHEIKNGFNKIDKYISWAECVRDIIREFSQNIVLLRRKGYKVAAFAASAKGNTLLNCCLANTDLIKYIADETPEKIGKFSPGTGIPIVNKQQIINDPPDYLVILSWNFSQEIMEKLKPIYNGKFILPIPEFTVL